MDQHPDFLAAPESRRWAGSLGDLFSQLQSAAAAAPDRWATSVIVPSGHWILLRASTEEVFRYELRICVQRVPTGPEEWTTFGQEVEHFRREITLDLGRRWGSPIIETLRDGTVACATLPALLAGETERDRSSCPGPGNGTTCGTLIKFDPAFNPNRCDRCARIAGQIHIETTVVERRHAKERVPDLLDRRKGDPYREDLT